MFPLSFREFISLAEPEIKLTKHLELCDFSLFRKISTLLRFSGKLQELFEAYLQFVNIHDFKNHPEATG